MRSHSLQPSSWQFVGPLRSSSFGRDARWNLNLGSRFPKRKKNKKKKDQNAQRISSSFRNFVSYAEFEKSTSKARNENGVDFSNLISWNRLPRENAPTRSERLWQPARSYLLIFNRHTRSILPILPNPIFKRWQNRRTNTFVLRFSRIMLGRKKSYTRKKRPGTPPTPELGTLFFHTLSLRTVFLKSTDDG